MTTSQNSQSHQRSSSQVVMTYQCGSRRPNLNDTKMRRHYDVACRVGRNYLHISNQHKILLKMST